MCRIRSGSRNVFRRILPTEGLKCVRRLNIVDSSVLCIIAVAEFLIDGITMYLGHSMMHDV